MIKIDLNDSPSDVKSNDAIISISDIAFTTSAPISCNPNALTPTNPKIARSPAELSETSDILGKYVPDPTIKSIERLNQKLSSLEGINLSYIHKERSDLEQFASQVAENHP